MTRALTMAQTAERVGLSYSRFAHVWRALPGFPAPFRGRSWSAEAVDAWIAARSEPITAAPPATPRLDSVARQRAQLQALRA